MYFLNLISTHCGRLVCRYWTFAIASTINLLQILCGRHISMLSHIKHKSTIFPITYSCFVSQFFLFSHCFVHGQSLKTETDTWPREQLYLWYVKVKNEWETSERSQPNVYACTHWQGGIFKERRACRLTFCLWRREGKRKWLLEGKRKNAAGLGTSVYRGKVWLTKSKLSAHVCLRKHRQCDFIACAGYILRLTDNSGPTGSGNRTQTH